MKTFRPMYALVFALMLYVICIATVPKSYAMNLSRQGFDVNPSNSSDFGSDSFKKSINNLSTTGATSVSLIIPYLQYNSYNPNMGNAWNTPTDSSLAAGIQYIHSLGMKVTLRVHLDASDQSWRAYINTPDRDGWFNNYGNILHHFAQIGQQNGVEDIALGQELINMTSANVNSSNTSHWQSMIQSIRGVYFGKLYYGANSNSSFGSWYDEKDNINFWSSLDYIGMSAYPTLSYNTGASLQELQNSWDQFNNQVVMPTFNKYGKQITFTEVGFRSINTAFINPWDYSRNDPYDGNAQANAYKSFFSYYKDKSVLNGAFIWLWSSDPNAGGQGNTDYLVQNKPAQQVVKDGFQGNIVPVQGYPTFNATATSAGATINSDVAIKSNINNSSQFNSNGLNIDVEIFNSSNQRVLQNVFSNQSINASQQLSFDSKLNTPNADKYTVQIGVFSSDWKINYLWSNNAGSFTISNSSPTPTPSPSPTPITVNSQISIWWPAASTGVSGIQPFKARIDNQDLNNYTMYWQVDDGQLNLMANNTQGAPHKESDVDLSGWKWKSDKNYVINFVAKDPNGHIISQKSVPIIVYN